MNNCVLIELSRKTVAFSYYTDGLATFTPLSAKEPRPLAVWLSSPKITLGELARREALKGNPEAFYDLFEARKRPGKVSLMGSDYTRDMLVPLALRAGLQEFCLEKLGRELDSNVREEMPIIISFAPDIEQIERNVVLACMQFDGFLNVASFSNDDRIDVPSNRSALTLWGNGADLYWRLRMPNGKDINGRMPGAAVDTRVDTLARMVYGERLSPPPLYLNYENEQDVVKEAVRQFLQSSSAMVDDSFYLSDGRRYSYYLAREDVGALSTKSTHVDNMNTLAHKLQVYDRPEKMQVYLLEGAADNELLAKACSEVFPYTEPLTQQLRGSICGSLMQYAFDQGFNFPPVEVDQIDPTYSENKKPEPKPTTEHRNTQEPMPFRDPEPKPGSPMMKRVDAELKPACETMAKVGMFEPLYQLVQNFKAQAAADSEAVAAADKLMRDLVPAVVLEQIEGSPADRQELDGLKITVNTLVQAGQGAVARSLVEAFSGKMAAKGVKAFNAEISELLSKVGNVSAPQPPVYEPPTPQPPVYEQQTPQPPVYEQKTPPQPPTNEVPRNPWEQTTPPPTQPKQPVPKRRPGAADDSRFRQMRARVRAEIENKHFGQALTLLNDFEEKMHSKGIYDYDEHIASLREKARAGM